MSLDGQIRSLISAILADRNKVKSSQVETLFSMGVPKPGDTLSASTTAEQAFASKFLIKANKLNTIGQVVKCGGYGSFITSAAGPSQNPKVRLGTPATSLTSRGLVADGGSLNLLLGASNVLYKYETEMTVRSTGVNGSLWCASTLLFVSMASGQSTPFMAGPTPGKGGLWAGDLTVDNEYTLSDQFGSATPSNSNTLQTMLATLYPAVS